MTVCNRFCASIRWLVDSGIQLRNLGEAGQLKPYCIVNSVDLSLDCLNGSTESATVALRPPGVSNRNKKADCGHLVVSASWSAIWSAMCWAIVSATWSATWLCRPLGRPLGCVGQLVGQLVGKCFCSTSFPLRSSK